MTQTKTTMTADDILEPYETVRDSNVKGSLGMGAGVFDLAVALDGKAYYKILYRALWKIVVRNGS